MKKFNSKLAKAIFGSIQLHRTKTILEDYVETNEIDNVADEFIEDVALRIIKSAKENINILEQVCNLICERALKISKNDPVVAHIVASSIDNMNLNGTSKYDLENDGVLNEMLLSKIKNKISKNESNATLLIMYFKENNIDYTTPEFNFLFR